MEPEDLAEIAEDLSSKKICLLFPMRFTQS